MNRDLRLIASGTLIGALVGFTLALAPFAGVIAAHVARNPSTGLVLAGCALLAIGGASISVRAALDTPRRSAE